MLSGKKVIVVMPAYQAEKTLLQTYENLPHDVVDDVILVDDCSSDRTAEIASSLGITTIVHKQNTGYGGNQKTCYETALAKGADIVVMVHPDYQYEPKLVTALAALVASGVYDAAIASRILGKTALAGGMPVYKYAANRFLTLFQNIVIGAKLSEYHTGFRAFSREVLTRLPLHRNSDDFIFDNEMLAQIIGRHFQIGEISCPTKYFEGASSINLARSMKYGLLVLKVSVLYRLHRWRIYRYSILQD